MSCPQFTYSECCSVVSPAAHSHRNAIAPISEEAPPRIADARAAALQRHVPRPTMVPPLLVDAAAPPSDAEARLSEFRHEMRRVLLLVVRAVLLKEYSQYR